MLYSLKNLMYTMKCRMFSFDIIELREHYLNMWYIEKSILVIWPISMWLALSLSPACKKTLET